MTLRRGSGLVVTAGKVVYEVLQRRHLSSIHKLELLYEVVEMLETGVEMRFLSKRNDLVEVGVVDMRVDSK